jgi:O-antigen ligase
MDSDRKMAVISTGRNKEIHLPPKSFMVDKNAVYAMPVAALIVVLFSFLVTNEFTILLYLLIVFFIFLKGTKVFLPRNLVTIVMIMLLGVGIMAHSYGEEPLITIPTIHLRRGGLSADMFLTSIVGFLVFIVGYFYSFIVKRPLKTLRYVFLYAWALVSMYFMVTYGFFIGNSLMLGNLTVILLPYMYLVFVGKPNSRFIFSLIILSYLMVTLCRTAFVAAVIFFLTYYIYPYLIVNKRRYKLFFPSFMIIIFLLIALYLAAMFFSSDSPLISGFGLLDDISRMFFGGKGLGRGREILWGQLLPYIIDKPLFGYGINQESGFFKSTAAILGYRGLDAHSIYFELLIRGGILLISFYLILFYKIWGSFYSTINSQMSRIAASGFMAFLFIGAALPIGITGGIAMNTLLWFYWGVASGYTWKKNHQIIKYEYSKNV